MTRKKTPISHDVEIELDGRRWTGSYTVSSSGMLEVRTINGSKAARLGALPPDHLAKMLLRELIRDEKRLK